MTTPAAAAQPEAAPRSPEQLALQARIDASLAWVTRTFSAYYRDNPPPMPSRFARREFGFLWAGKKFFLRHTSFTSPESLHEFLVREAPHHAYYSTAYYDKPHAATMVEKTWRGADLIFDLDADHLPNASKLSFEEQLREVKKQASKLLHEFILGDFGFDPAHVRIVFSGGRGYHFHVTNPRVLQLDSAARREIVDYISPNDTVATALAESYVTEKTWDAGGTYGAERDKVIPPGDAPGWDGRITRTIVETIRQAAEAGKFPDIKGVGPVKERAILDMATPERLDRMLKTGRLTIPALNDRKVLAGFIQYAKVHSGGETDEPVTADVKRLIRLPGSLHGKTGLRVTPIPITDFDAFEPLRDAVALPLDQTTRVTVSKETDVSLATYKNRCSVGEQEVPVAAAAFLIMRRSALISPPQGAPHA